MRTYGRPILIGSIVLNLAMTVGFSMGVLGLIPLDDPFPLIGAVGMVISVAQLVGAITSERPAAGWIAGLGALVSGVGWGSWLVVGLTADPDDPVINIAGLLIDPGAVLALIALVVLAFSSRLSEIASGDRTRAGVFAIVVTVLAVIRFALYSRYDYDYPVEWVPTIVFLQMLLPLIAVVTGIYQMVIAAKCRAPQAARTLSGAASVLLVAGTLALFQILWPAGVVLCVAAVFVEHRARKVSTP